MNFVDSCIFRVERFSIGTEEISGKHYLSMPIANPYVDYEEYYEIDDDDFFACPNNLDQLKQIAEKSRARQKDARLIVKSGKLRGSPI